jgi:hypothetical protein
MKEQRIFFKTNKQTKDLFKKTNKQTNKQKHKTEEFEIESGCNLDSSKDFFFCCLERESYVLCVGVWVCVCVCVCTGECVC